MSELTLGGFRFEKDEVPQNINFGGDQSLAVKQLVGGKRIVNAMGRVDDDISWSGLLFGSNALLRSELLDSLRVIGNSMPLVWSSLNFMVVIKSFKASFERDYQIFYNITVTVIEDLNKPTILLEALSYTNAVASLLTEANFLADSVRNPSVIGAITALGTAIGLVGNLSTATPTELSSITGPLNSAFTATKSAIGSLTSSTFGGA